MKKVLLASTALVAFAGAANAEIKLSGYAEMGVASVGSWDSGNFHIDSVTNFHSDIQFKVAMTSATDSGLEFGASVEVRDTNGNQATDGLTKFDNEQVWVSGSFGKITLGEVDGALDWAANEIYMGSAIADDHSTHAGAYTFGGLDGGYNYNRGSDQVMRYEYSFGDFAVAVSAELDPLPNVNYTTVSSTTSGTFTNTYAYYNRGDAILGVGVHWAGNVSGADVAVGLGYQTVNNYDVTALSLQAKLANGIQANLGYADFDGSNNWWGVGLGYTTGALLTQINYGEYDAGNKGWGLVANYDLGGGASAQFGYGHSNNASGLPDTWSAGLALSF